MTRTVLVVLAFAATSAAAQQPVLRIPNGQPFTPRLTPPPTLPLRRPVQPLLSGARKLGNIRYQPAASGYYYAPYPLELGYSEPDLSLNITNIVNPENAASTALLNAMVLAQYQSLLAGAEGRAGPGAPPRFGGGPNGAGAYADDITSPEAIVSALYDVLSGPRGTPRNWDRFQSLFADNARLVSTHTAPGAAPRLTVMSTNVFAAEQTPVLERGMFEREASHVIDRQGDVAHVHSTYEFRHTSGEATPYQRGINAIELTRDGGRWFITQITWDAEQGNALPEKYLHAPPAPRRQQ